MKNYEYLTSGILEAHLLGLTTKREKDELEQVLATDPEVLTQLKELELSVEEYFQRNAVPPPPEIREKIELRINNTEIEKWSKSKQTSSESKSSEPRPNEPSYVHVEVDDTHIRVHKYWRTAFIAVFTLSKVFLILGLYYYFKTVSLEQEIIRLKSTTDQTSPLPNRQIK